jgi:hypothetical protein
MLTFTAGQDWTDFETGGDVLSGSSRVITFPSHKIPRDTTVCTAYFKNMLSFFF